MNIIVHRYNSICEPDFIDAFRTCGIEVIEDTAEMTNKNIPLEEKISKLGEMILTNHPMFVFSINFFPYISMVCEKLGVMYVCVSVDCPVVELFSNQIKNKCNRVFLFDYAQYLDIHEENPECIFYMPLGVNTVRIDETIGAPDWNNTKYQYDVSFIGSLYNEKNDFPQMYESLDDRNKGYIDGMLAAQEQFSGQELLEKTITGEVAEAIKKAAGSGFYSSELSVHNIDKFVAVNNYLSTELTVRDRLMLLGTVSEYADSIGAKLHLFTRSNTDMLSSLAPHIQIHGGVKSLTEMPLVFRQSKINLNPTMRSIRTGLPQRIWDICGAGGFLLTNYQTELPEWLEVGKHVDCYESVDEACEKIDFYLSHEDERCQIAQNGYEEVKARHQVLNRVIDIIKAIT